MSDIREKTAGQTDWPNGIGNPYFGIAETHCCMSYLLPERKGEVKHRSEDSAQHRNEYCRAVS